MVRVTRFPCASCSSLHDRLIWAAAEQNPHYLETPGSPGLAGGDKAHVGFSCKEHRRKAKEARQALRALGLICSGFCCCSAGAAAQPCTLPLGLNLSLSAQPGAVEPTPAAGSSVSTQWGESCPRPALCHLGAGSSEWPLPSQPVPSSLSSQITTLCQEAQRLKF